MNSSSNAFGQDFPVGLKLVLKIICQNWILALIFMLICRTIQLNFMKRLVLNLLTIVAVLAVFSIPAFAQSPVENLQKGVEEYNAARAYIDGFDAKTITNDNLTTLKTRMERGVALLDRVLADGNADQVKTSRYFRGNFKYEYAFALGMKGENRKAYDVMKEIERDITGLTASDFPLRYEFFGKNFVINWDNFSPTQAEYLTGLGEIAYNLGYYEDALKFTKLGYKHPSTSEWLKYVSVNKLIDIYAKNDKLMSETEYLDYVLESIQVYDKLNADSKETVKEYNYPTTLRGTGILIGKSELSPNSANIARCGKAAVIAVGYEKSHENALRLFDLCYRSNYQDIPEFDDVALNMAKVMRLAGKDIERANFVGLAALDKIASRLGNKCEDMPRIAEAYWLFGMTTKATAMDDRHRKCVAEQVVERQRQEEMARKQAEADRKRQHRYEHPFNMYLGFNLLPVLTSPDKMDFGGHVDLRGRRVAHSFGYTIINKKHDLYSDNQQWDGFRAFYALKIFGKSLNNQFAYTGLYLGYSEKDFSPLDGQLTSKTIPGDFRQATITPTDKQYDAVWNSGAQILGKGFGMDLWYGMGASYYQISYTDTNLGTAIDIDEFGITGHDFFEKRSKKDGFSIFIRLGISIGLNLGRARD